MKHSATSFFAKDGVFAHGARDISNYPEHRVYLEINDSIDKSGCNGVQIWMNDAQWVAFKNSVLQADEKMFGRHHVTNG